MQAVRRNSGSGDEKAADASLGLLLRGQDGHILPLQVEAKREWRPLFFFFAVLCHFDFEFSLRRENFFSLPLKK